ncbi:MAG: sulfurtransferase [Chloroflexi bacterium]|nr:sulfurtransferase [Chloroflexota bacterium]
MTDPGRLPLVPADWLAEHLRDAELRIVHVSPDRSVFDERHIPGAVFGDLHTELAERGRAAETGDAEREYLVPSREALSATLARWGVGPGDRIVFYDDVGWNRHAVRGYWLLRYYRWPADHLHVLDGGLAAWEASGAMTSAAEEPSKLVERVDLPEPDAGLIATAEQVLTWSAGAAAGGGGGPVRILDVRTPEEYRGEDVRAVRGGHIPGAVNLPFDAFLADDGRFRPAAEIHRLADEAAAGDASSIRATYCQGGIRAALSWFALSELAGLPDVRNYAGSWEEWGNRSDTPIE